MLIPVRGQREHLPEGNAIEDRDASQARSVQSYDYTSSVHILFCYASLILPFVCLQKVPIKSCLMWGLDSEVGEPKLDKD